MISLILVAGIKRNKYFRGRKCRVYLGVKTCEVFLCFRAIIFLSCIVLNYQWRLCIYCFTSLVSFTGFQFTAEMYLYTIKRWCQFSKKRLHFVILEWHISHLKTKKRSKCCTYNRFPGPKSYRKTGVFYVKIRLLLWLGSTGYEFEVRKTTRVTSVFQSDSVRWANQKEADFLGISENLLRKDLRLLTYNKARLYLMKVSLLSSIYSLHFQGKRTVDLDKTRGTKVGENFHFTLV